MSAGRSSWSSRSGTATSSARRTPATRRATRPATAGAVSWPAGRDRPSSGTGSTVIARGMIMADELLNGRKATDSELAAIGHGRQCERDRGRGGRRGPADRGRSAPGAAPAGDGPDPGAGAVNTVIREGCGTYMGLWLHRRPARRRARSACGTGVPPRGGRGDPVRLPPGRVRAGDGGAGRAEPGRVDEALREDARERGGPVRPYDYQSETACCPRQTIPDSCSCLEDCGCMCLDCDCAGWGEEHEGE